MKLLSRIIIVGVIYLFNPQCDLLWAQVYETDHAGDGEHWKEVRDGYGTYWYGWIDDNGDWQWQTDAPTPWPPDYDDGDPGQHHDLEGEENDWMDDWDDNHVSGDQDDWWDWWDDFWDVNGDINNDPSNTNNNPTACPELLVLASQPNGAGKRQRMTVGIGEQFRVYVKNICGGQTTWEIVNAGSEGELDGGNEVYAELRANFKPGIITIKANITNMQENCALCPSNLEIDVTVIEPTEVRFQQINFCVGRHDFKRPSAGFHSKVYLYPETVNFYNVSVKERNPINHNTCTGDYWAGLPCPEHKPSSLPWAFTATIDPGFGTRSEEGDEVYFALGCHKDAQNPSGVDAGLAGFLEWKIEYVYLRPIPSGYEEVPFVTQTQTGRNFGSVPGQPTNLLFQVRKKNEVFSSHLNDPEICPVFPLSQRCH